MCLAEGLPATVVDTEFVGATRQFLLMMGAEPKPTPADFRTNLPQEYVRLVRVDTGRSDATVFVCADVPSAGLFTGENFQRNPKEYEFFWILRDKLPMTVLRALEAAERS